jgi:serine/threonine-protein kinase Chk2
MAEYPPELRKKYVVSRELGTGACGTVRLGFHRDIDNHRYPVAIKIISKKVISLQNGGSDAALNEVKILRAVDHPSVIRMEDVVDTDKHLFIILELAVGGELFDKIIQVVLSLYLAHYLKTSCLRQIELY